MKNRLRIGDLVTVSATATGMGTARQGVITRIERFMGEPLIDVTYIDYPGGIVVTNTGLLEKK